MTANSRLKQLNCDSQRRLALKPDTCHLRPALLRPPSLIQFLQMPKSVGGGEHGYGDGSVVSHVDENTGGYGICAGSDHSQDQADQEDPAPPEYVRDPANGYVSVAFSVEDGMEISSWTGR